jgi:hypothetical protein
VRRDREPADSLKRLRAATADKSKLSKLAPAQRFATSLNEGLLLLQLGSQAALGEGSVLAEAMALEYPRSAKPALLALALALRGSSGTSSSTSSSSSSGGGGERGGGEPTPGWRVVVDRAQALAVALAQKDDVSSCAYDDVSMAPAEAQLFAVQVRPSSF